MTLNDAKLLGDLTATWISSILVVRRRPLYQIIKFKFVSQWGKNAKICTHCNFCSGNAPLWFPKRHSGPES